MIDDHLSLHQAGSESNLQLQVHGSLSHTHFLLPESQAQCPWQPIQSSVGFQFSLTSSVLEGLPLTPCERLEKKDWVLPQEYEAWKYNRVSETAPLGLDLHCKEAEKGRSHIGLCSFQRGELCFDTSKTRAPKVAFVEYEFSEFYLAW